MKPGVIVGERFTIEREAGAGGMGRVYRAHDAQSGQLVALKVLHDMIAVDANVARFAREAEVLASFKHPGIVEYVAHGSTPDGAHFLAMEWVDGVSLTARLVKGPAPTVAESVALVLALARALAVAHAQGVVHRDIKPANVMLAGGDLLRPKLLDFGIARELDLDHSMTQTGMILGTAGYMAPEQARGSRELDARADVFALGCLLFRCLCGRTPFVGDNVIAVLAKTVIDAAPLVSELVPSIAPSIEAAVATMLATSPRDRPRDAGAAADLLASLTMPTTMHEASPRSIRRAEAITGSEQRFLFVVIGRLASVDTSAFTTFASIAKSFEGEFEPLARGSFVVVIATAGAPSDLALRAARCAIALAACAPGTSLGIGFGRAIPEERLPLADVIDGAARAASRAGADATDDRTRGTIHVDPAIARLLDSRFELREVSGGLALVRERPSATRHRLLGQATPCVGRERDLAFLAAMLREAVDDETARVAIVTAGPGAGKTRLCEELLAAVAGGDTGATVLLAHGDALRGREPLGLLGDALRRASGCHEADNVEEQKLRFSAWVAQQSHPTEDIERIRTFLGEVARVPGSDASEALASARADASIMSAAMQRAWLDWVRAELARGPLVILLEDLHWADAPSVAFLDATLRTFARCPLMVVAFARPEVKTAFPRLWADREPHELHLAALTRRASEKLARSVLLEIDDATLDKIVERAAGNAFYLEELIRCVGEGRSEMLPPTVIGMVQARLDALGPELARVLRGASVFGHGFWPRGLATVLGRTPASTKIDEWIASLIERELIERRLESAMPGEPELAFTHALVRDTAYELLTDADRALAHRLAGGWLEEAGFDGAAALGEHFDRGGDFPRAARWFVQAAEEMLERHDETAALALADRAASVGARVGLLGRARLVQAVANNRRGDASAARKCAGEALKLCAAGSISWYRAIPPLMLALIQAGTIDEAGAWIPQVASVKPIDGAEDEAIIAMCEAITLVGRQGRGDLAAPLVPHVERLFSGRSFPPRVAARIESVRAMLARDRQDFSASLASTRTACELYALAHDAVMECSTRLVLALALFHAGHLDDMLTELDVTLASAERLGLWRVVALAFYCRSLAMWTLGRSGLALALADRGAEAMRNLKDVTIEGRLRIVESLAALDVGDTLRAEAAAEKALAIVATVPGLRRHALVARARVLLAQDRTSEALGVATEATSLPVSTVEMEGPLVPLVHAAALAACGEHAHASEVLVSAAATLRTRADCFGAGEARDRALRATPLHALLLDKASAAPSRVP